MLTYICIISMVIITAYLLAALALHLVSVSIHETGP